MKEGKLIGTLAQLSKDIEQLKANQQNVVQQTRSILQNLDLRLQTIALYINAKMEYDEKCWILPIGFWPGNKIFQKIHKKNIDEYKAEQIKAREDMLVKMQEEKEKDNEDKKVPAENEGRKDQPIPVDSECNADKCE